MSNKKNEFYFDLYEKLYQTGYHNNQELSHTKKLFPFLNEVDGGKKNIKVLDVGCSHGLAVQQLKDMGYDAYGVDVSETAIKFCEERGLTTCKVGSATDLPFDDGFFDLIISTDVLEHLLPKDVDRTISEFKRVNKGFCLLAIACDAEGNKTPLREVQNKFGEYRDLSGLHTTIMNPDSWDKHFSDGGYNKIRTISYVTFDYEVIYKPL